MTDNYRTFAAEVEFTWDADAETLAEMHKLARKLDEANNGVVDETYTDIQAFQIAWHLEPKWVHEHVLAGWTLEQAWDEETGTMRPIWPSKVVPE